MLNLSVEVHASGPAFNGLAEKEIEAGCRDIEKRVAIDGATIIRSELDHVLRKQTPYYRLQNEAKADPPGYKIWDRGVVYGPWLEGVGSRNFPATRFRGYSTYRRMVHVIDTRAQTIAQYTMAEHVARVS